MAYLLTVLTFLTLILFYSFFPRTDTVELLDKPTAKTAVASLVAQHSAALQAATVLRKQANGSSEMEYENWNLANNFIPQNLYQRFLTPGLNAVPDGYNPVSVRVCVDNFDGTITNICGKRQVAGANDLGTTDFIITYLTREAVDSEYGRYLSGLAVRALGENVYLTNYSEKQHLTTNCGIMEYAPTKSGYVLSNTRYQTVDIPRAFATLNFNDNDNPRSADNPCDGENDLCIDPTRFRYLLCITRVSVAYEDNATELTDFVQINE